MVLQEQEIMLQSIWDGLWLGIGIALVGVGTFVVFYMLYKLWSER